MAKGELGKVVEHLRGLLGPSAGPAASDGQLLERFAREREEASFAALVERHGGLVFGVCRRLLGDEQDAEDAFQATFLVLARKATSIRKRDSVASWLYGVAYRVAARARAGNRRRRDRERHAQPVPAGDPVAEVVWREIRPILDEELHRLPEKYRVPVVLCYLENKSQTETARLLGWTKGTVSGRLARARELLRRRLTRRGLTLSGGVLAAALTEKAAAAVPVALGCTTIQAATLVAGQAGAASLASVSVTVLVQGALQAMWMTKLKVVSAVLLAFMVLASGAAWVAQQALADTAARETRDPNRKPDRALPAAAAQNNADDEISRLKKENELLKRQLRLLKREIAVLKREAQAQTDRARLERLRAEDAALQARKAAEAQRQADELARKRAREAAAKLDPKQKANPPQVLSPDGRTAARADGKAIWLVEAQTGKILWKTLGHQDDVTALAFHPDGKTLASGSKDQTVRLWDAATGKEIRRLARRRAAIRSVTFSKDGKTLTTRATDNTTTVWDVATGKIVSTKEKRSSP